MSRQEPSCTGKLPTRESGTCADAGDREFPGVIARCWVCGQGLASGAAARVCDDCEFRAGRFCPQCGAVKVIPTRAREWCRTCLDRAAPVKQQYQGD